MEPNHTANNSFFQNNGECAQLIRNFDWASTSLGSAELWPISLRNTVAMLLSSKFPMFLWWGKDLIQFYNDAYRPSLGDNGKHPKAIGQRAEECWPEIWDFIAPMIEKVLNEGQSFWYDDLLLPIFRNGTLEDVYWTFSYSPVYGDDGAICGVIVVCTETTREINERLQIGEDKNELEFAIEAAELGTWDLNPETGAFTANARLKEWFGLKADDAIPLSLATNVMAPEDRERVEKAINKAMQFDSGGHYDIEYKIIHPHTLNERIVRAKGKVWFNEQKIAKRFNGTLQDISEERRNEELFRSVIDQAPVATCLFAGRQMIIEIANDIMLGYWGTDDSTIGKPLKSAVPELEGQPFLQILDEVFTTGITYEDKAAAVQLKLGVEISTFYFDFTYKPLRDASGKIYGVMNMSVDVTEQVLLQKRADEIQRQVMESFEQSPVGIATMDIEGLIYQTANPFYGQLVGRDPEMLIGKSMFEAIPEIKGQGFEVLIDNVIATGNPYVAKEVSVAILRNEAMEKIYVDLTYQPRRSASGKITGILIVAVDVTQQVLSRHVIEEAQLALNSTVDLAKLATWNLDLASGEFSYSDRFKNWLGLPDVISSIEDFYELLSQKDRKNLKSGIESILNPESESLSIVEYEITNQTTGQMRIVSANAQVFFDADGHPEHIIGTAQNITKERELQEELKFLVRERTRELEEVNYTLELSNKELQQFAYIASHDLQEPIRKISVFIEMLEASLGVVDPKAKNYLDKIRSSSARMSNLIRDVLSLSQLSNVVPVFVPVNLEQIAVEVRTELELMIEQKGAVVVFSGLLVIDGIPLQMSQLFGNLISNSLKYSRTGVTPEISITGRLLSDHETAHYPAHSNWYLIEFKDNGIGFEQQYAEKIFNIFQRLHAKNEFGGTGIGLAICKKIVQNHNGYIHAKAAENQGAVFSIVLPVQQSQVF